jgi:hypothetical protein
MVVVDCYAVLDDDGSQPLIAISRFSSAESDALLAGYVPGVGGAPGTVDPAIAQTIAVALAEAAAQVPRGAP